MLNGFSMMHDGAWLFSKLRKGYTVVDIGFSSDVVRKGLWYGTEEIVINLWKRRNLWKYKKR